MSPRPVCIPVGVAMGAACDVSYRAAQISVATANAQTVLRMIFPSYFTHPLLGEGRHGSIIPNPGRVRSGAAACHGILGWLSSCPAAAAAAADALPRAKRSSL